MDKAFIHLLQCPKSGGSLTLSEDGLFLLSEQGNCRYPIENGIALLLNEHAQALTSDSANAPSSSTQTSGQS